LKQRLSSSSKNLYCDSLTNNQQNSNYNINNNNPQNDKKDSNKNNNNIKTKSGGELSTVSSAQNLLATGHHNVMTSNGYLNEQHEDHEANAAIIYDNMLDKIVDGLDAPK
jgi:hypothetical protein